MLASDLLLEGKKRISEMITGEFFHFECVKFNESSLYQVNIQVEGHFFLDYLPIWLVEPLKFTIQTDLNSVIGVNTVSETDVFVKAVS